VKLFDDIQFKDVKNTVYLGLKNSKKKNLVHGKYLGIFSI